jgi:glycosyltransferase involved in cell wall biosynthesis
VSTDPPRVSIGMPVHNGDTHVGEAIESVLAQTFTSLELVISDNGSTDDTEAICRRYATRDPRILYTRFPENRGAAANYNSVFHASRGEYFRWLAHDDLLEPSYLERCVAVLDESPPDVVLCFPTMRFITYDGEPSDIGFTGPAREALPPYDRISFRRLMRVPERLMPQLVFGLTRRSALAKTRLVGAYNRADLVLVTELRLLGEFRHIPECLFLNRMHEYTVEFRRSRLTTGGEARWYDPQRSRGPAFPEALLALERTRAILRHGGDPLTKIICLFWLAVGHTVVRLPDQISRGWESWRARLFRLWENGSEALLRRPSAALWFLRAWAFAGGLRRRDGTLLGLAIARGEGASARLYSFGAMRIIHRPGPAVDDLLDEWIHDRCEARQVAAAQAMASAPDRFWRRAERLSAESELNSELWPRARTILQGIPQD